MRPAMSEISISSWQSGACLCKGTCESPDCGADKKWSGVWWDHCGKQVQAGSDPAVECKSCWKGNWAARFAQKGGQKGEQSGQKDDEMMKAIAELKVMMEAIVEDVTETKEQIQVPRGETKEMMIAIEELKKIQIAASFFETPLTDS